jgi:hypothetical protein
MQKLKGGFDHLWSEKDNVFDSNGPKEFAFTQ